ncbi:MAG: metal-dependent hydrolase [Lachnospiraceae bacterium]|nr:metal-dependent hydrolase [Lachnospiraceae bacterium]
MTLYIFKEYYIRNTAAGNCRFINLMPRQLAAGYLTKNGKEIIMKKLIDRIKDEKEAFTHAGRFHADDVFSAALLRIINPDITIIRGNSVPDGFEGIVFDIGCGEFDHHQADSRVRENGVPFAAFGLLWEQLGEDILGEDGAQNFDEKFVQPLDENDNTGRKNVTANIIGDFNSCWDNETDNDKEFLLAVEFAGYMLKNRFAVIKSQERAAEIINQAVSNNDDSDILVLEKALPWRKYVIPTGIKYVVHPSNRGGYCGIAVPKEEGSQELKCPFIKEWRGKEREELKSISGIDTLSFCHKSGFMVAADTKDDVITACRKSLENPEIREMVFVNCTEDASDKWEESKILAAKDYGDITDIPMPAISIETTDKEIQELSKDISDKIIKLYPNAVYVKGNGIVMYEIIRILLKKHITVLSDIKDDKGKFVSFREYQNYI